MDSARQLTVCLGFILDKPACYIALLRENSIAQNSTRTKSKTDACESTQLAKLPLHSEISVFWKDN